MVSFKKILKKNLPNSLLNKYHIFNEKNILSKVKSLTFDESNLRKITLESVNKLYQSKKLESLWLKNYQKVKEIDNVSVKHSTNLGDRRMIHYLINSFKPKRVLEIGTHTGSSTIIIANAMQSYNRKDKHLTTCDIIDVNCDKIKNYKKYNSKMSPLELSKKFGYESIITFVKSDSISFLKNTNERFDFIFLDSGHSAFHTYQEICNSLNKLNNNGVLVLHDYFHKFQPIWNNNIILPGVAVAVKRILSTNKNINILPLSELPWKTKLNSNKTSLAILTKYN